MNIIRKVHRIFLIYTEKNSIGRERDLRTLNKKYISNLISLYFSLSFRILKNFEKKSKTKKTGTPSNF